MPGGRSILHLGLQERRDAFLTAAYRSGRLPQVLEKDVWVVWALGALFRGPLGEVLAFKGGTSRSKAYQLIDRFSEDVDLTYDIRRILSLPRGEPEIIPTTNSQAKRLTERVNEALPEVVRAEILPALDAAVLADGAPARPRFVVEENNVSVSLDYESVFDRLEYLKPRIKLEFGARSTREPVEWKQVNCDASAYLQGVDFPTAKPRVMLPVRTFWEKVTLAHAFCQAGGPTERNSRHWYDISKVYERHPEYCSNKAIAAPVVGHKSRFFRKGGVNYAKVLEGELQLVPQGERVNALREDFTRMCDSGFLPADSAQFGRLLEACHEIEDRINEAMKAS